MTSSRPTSVRSVNPALRRSIARDVRSVINPKTSQTFPRRRARALELAVVVPTVALDIASRAPRPNSSSRASRAMPVARVLPRAALASLWPRGAREPSRARNDRAAADDDDADDDAAGPPSRARGARRRRRPLRASMSAVAAPAPTRATTEVTMDDLSPNDYAYKALKRRFDHLDEGAKGYVTSDDMRRALEKLKVPCTAQSADDFVRRTIDEGRTRGERERERDDGEGRPRMTFKEFGNFALRRERELLRTFQKFDGDRSGYLTAKQLKRVLMREGYATDDDDVEAMMYRIKAGEGAFSKGKGLFNAANEKFVTLAKAIDFTEFRDFLMLSDAMDATEALSVWSRSTVDVGDVSLAFASKRKANGGAGEVIKHLLVGAISGGVSRTVVAPLERAKIEYMLDSTTIARDGGLVGTLNRIVRDEGAGGLFRGNTLNVLRIAPTKAVEFFVYDKFKDYIIRNGDQTELDGAQRMLGGSVASMCGTALTHPVDTLRSRVSGTGMLLGDCWKQLVANEGYGALWKGLGANMVRVAPYGAINFYVYDACKGLYRRQFGEKAKMSALPTMCFGALAGAAAQTGVYPLEMIQRRIQVAGMKKGAGYAYKNMFHGIYVVGKNEGIGALYAGLIPNYAKILPSAAISFYVYELMKQVFEIDK